MKSVLAAAVAATALAAGPALTHGQLVARADAICVRYESLLASPPGVDGQLGTPAYDRAWIRLFERQRAALGALTPPARDRAAYTSLLRTLPAVRNAFRQLTMAIEAGEPVRTWRPLSHRLETAEHASDLAARAVGLKRCFRSGSADHH
jgi:hypothetical protein